MHPAIGIDDASSRILGHPGCADMVAAIGAVAEDFCLERGLIIGEKAAA